MELLYFGDKGWGDELLIATLMTIAVSITAMFIGFFFALIFVPLKLSKKNDNHLLDLFDLTEPDSERVSGVATGVKQGEPV